MPARMVFEERCDLVARQAFSCLNRTHVVPTQTRTKNIQGEGASYPRRAVPHGLDRSDRRSGQPFSSRKGSDLQVAEAIKALVSCNP